MIACAPCAVIDESLHVTTLTDITAVEEALMCNTESHTASIYDIIDMKTGVFQDERRADFTVRDDAIFEHDIRQAPCFGRAALCATFPNETYVAVAPRIVCMCEPVDAQPWVRHSICMGNHG